MCPMSLPLDQTLVRNLSELLLIFGFFYRVISTDFSMFRCAYICILYSAYVVFCENVH